MVCAPLKGGGPEGRWRGGALCSGVILRKVVMIIGRYQDITGMKFGRLTALYPIEGTNPIKWQCKCDCGNDKVVLAQLLKNGATKSCGCYRRERFLTHGLYRTKLHGVWAGMLQRCYYPKHIDTQWYSEKQIEVCDEWRNDFQCFYDWAIESGYREGLSIDRKDNNSGYSPENCKWSTAKEQANNRTTNIVIEYDGRKQTLKQWAEEFGINYSTLYYRYKRGVDFKL